MDQRTEAMGKMLKKYVIKKVTEQVMSRLTFLSIPFLGTVLNPVVGLFVGQGLTWLLDKTILGAAVLWLVTNIDWNVDKMEKTTATLKDMLENPDKYTAQQWAQIEKDFDQNAVKLIRLNIVRLP